MWIKFKLKFTLVNQPTFYMIGQANFNSTIYLAVDLTKWLNLTSYELMAFKTEKVKPNLYTFKLKLLNP